MEDIHAILENIEALLETESDSHKTEKLKWARSMLLEHLESANDSMEFD
jgi:hypothetical protein